jgi:hypothetical protein
MIRTHLAEAKAATFCVMLPDPSRHNFATPTGTGFFISADGWFVTAAHVVTQDGTPTGKPRTDLTNAWLMKESYYSDSGAMVMGAMCPETEGLAHIDPALDFALLKVARASSIGMDFLIFQCLVGILKKVRESFLSAIRYQSSRFLMVTLRSVIFRSRRARHRRSYPL